MNAATSTVPLVGDEIKFTERQIKNFWRKVDKNGPTQPHMDTPCWVWTAGKFRQGYGSFAVGKSMIKTHRAAWIIERGHIPHDGSYHGICVCHRCDNRSCVRVDHLFLGTNADNMRDRDTKGRGNQVKGASHHARVHPERMARGDKHGARLHPESRPRGSDNGKAKLTEERVLDIRALHGTGEFTLPKLADMFGVQTPAIGKIVRRSTWRHLPKEWV